MSRKNLGIFIIKKRKLISRSSRQLALACEITPPYLNDIEKGKRMPSFEVLNKLAKELKLDEQDIYRLFDLAVDESKGKVSYDIAEYIMDNDDLRQCIRHVIKMNDNTIWKDLLTKINLEDQ